MCLLPTYSPLVGHNSKAMSAHYTHVGHRQADAASEALRHGGVSVTARHYIENKQRSVLGFGRLLRSGERTVVPG